MNALYLLLVDIFLYLWPSSYIEELMFKFITEIYLDILTCERGTKISETFTNKK